MIQKTSFYGLGLGRTREHVSNDKESSFEYHSKHSQCHGTGTGSYACFLSLSQSDTPKTDLCSQGVEIHAIPRKADFFEEYWVFKMHYLAGTVECFTAVLLKIINRIKINEFSFESTRFMWKCVTGVTPHQQNDRRQTVHREIVIGNRGRERKFLLTWKTDFPKVQYDKQAGCMLCSLGRENPDVAKTHGAFNIGK